MKKFMRYLAIVIFVCALAAGGLWLYQSQIAAQSTTGADSFTQVVAVQRGDIAAIISVVGQLDADQKEDLRFDRLSGVTALLSLKVQPGHVVEAGQALATIDTATYRQALDKAKTALQEAEQTLADLQTPASELDIAQADLAVAEATLDLEAAEDDLATLENPADLTDLQDAVQSARDSLALAQLQQTLTERDQTAGSERDLRYAVDWRERRIGELQDLAARGQANLEQREELAQERENLAELQADLAQAQAQRKISLQTAAAAVATAQAELADAQEALADAQSGGDDLALAKARVAVQQAQVARQAAAQARAELDAGAGAGDLAAAQADLKKKQLALAEAELDLAGATMIAPFAGVILQVNAEVGDRITSNSTILTIANLNELQVVAAIDETTIRQVAVGQQASITFDAFPGQTFSGQVLSVPLQGALQGGVMVYDVPISLVGAEDLPLLVGMTANVEIQVGQASDVLLLPTMALQNVGGFYQVLTPSSDLEGEPQAVPVEVGLSNGVYTQIVRGLNAGDQVVVQLSSASSRAFGGFGGFGGIPGGGVRMPR